MNKPLPESGRLHKLRVILAHVEDGLLVSLLLLMLVTAVAPILLRKVIALPNWTALLLNMSVLWVGLVGAMVATRNNAHIQIDVVTRFLPKRAKAGAGAFVELFAAIVCGVVAWSAAYFVLSEYEAATIAFAKVPVYVSAAIIPVAFGIMGIRYLLWSLTHAMEAIRGVH